MGYIKNNDSLCIRCAKGKPPKSIYKIKVAAASNHHQNRNNLQLETHTKNGIFATNHDNYMQNRLVLTLTIRKNLF